MRIGRSSWANSGRSGKIVCLTQSAVDLSRDPCSSSPTRLLTAPQQHYYYQPPARIVERSEPPQMSVAIGTSTGFTGYRLFLASGTRSTRFHRCAQARKR